MRSYGQGFALSELFRPSGPTPEGFPRTAPKGHHTFARGIAPSVSDHAYRDRSCWIRRKQPGPRLNEREVRDILAVDDLTQGDKFRNLRDCEIADYMDRAEFREFVRRGAPGAEARRRSCTRGPAPTRPSRTAGTCWTTTSPTRRSCSTGPGAPRAAGLRLQRVGLRRLAPLRGDARARGAAERLRLLEAALRQLRAAAACRGSPPRSSACATSTSTARARATRDAWPRWSGSFTSS